MYVTFSISVFNCGLSIFNKRILLVLYYYYHFIAILVCVFHSVLSVSFRVVSIGLCELSFLRLEYSVELSSTRLIPKVAINYRVAQNKRPLCCSFKFAIRQRFEMSKK